MQRRHRHFKSGQIKDHSCTVHRGVGDHRSATTSKKETYLAEKNVHNVLLSKPRPRSKPTWLKKMYTTFFFPNGCFRNRKDRGWWGVSVIGLRVGLGWEAELLQAAECAISLAAVRRIRMIVYLATRGCRSSLRTRPTTRWKVVRPRPDQPDRRRRLWYAVFFFRAFRGGNFPP